MQLPSNAMVVILSVTLAVTGWNLVQKLALNFVTLYLQKQVSSAQLMGAELWHINKVMSAPTTNIVSGRYMMISPRFTHGKERIGFTIIMKLLYGSQDAFHQGFA